MTKKAGFIKRIIAEKKLDCKKIIGRPIVSGNIKNTCVGRAAQTIERITPAIKKLQQRVRERQATRPSRARAESDVSSVASIAFSLDSEPIQKRKRLKAFPEKAQALARSAIKKIKKLVEKAKKPGRKLEDVGLPTFQEVTLPNDEPGIIILVTRKKDKLIRGQVWSLKQSDEEDEMEPDKVVGNFDFKKQRMTVIPQVASEEPLPTIEEEEPPKAPTPPPSPPKARQIRDEARLVFMRSQPLNRLLQEFLAPDRLGRQRLKEGYLSLTKEQKEKIQEALFEIELISDMFKGRTEEPKNEVERKNFRVSEDASTISDRRQRLDIPVKMASYLVGRGKTVSTKPPSNDVRNLEPLRFSDEIIDKLKNLLTLSPQELIDTPEFEDITVFDSFKRTKLNGIFLGREIPKADYLDALQVTAPDSFNIVEGRTLMKKLKEKIEQVDARKKIDEELEEEIEEFGREIEAKKKKKAPPKKAPSPPKPRGGGGAGGGGRRKIERQEIVKEYLDEGYFANTLQVGERSGIILVVLSAQRAKKSLESDTLGGGPIKEHGMYFMEADEEGDADSDTAKFVGKVKGIPGIRALEEKERGEENAGQIVIRYTLDFSDFEGNYEE